MLREMEAASEDDLTVLLSGAPASDAGEPPDTSFETAVRAAGSMAAFTLRSGHAVSLLLPERDWRPVRLTPDAASRRKLLGALAEAEPSRARPARPVPAGHHRRPHADAPAASSPSWSSAWTAISSSALLKLRRQGVAVSVVHVAAEDGAAGRRDAVGADDDSRRARPRRRRRALRQTGPRRRPARGPGGDVAAPGEGAMNGLRALLYVACFAGLAATAAVVAARVADPRRRAAPARRGRRRHARRRARARPPARLAAGAVLPAARRLPAGARTGARAATDGRRRSAPRLLRRPAPGRSGRLRPRRLPARRRRRRRTCGCCCRWSSTRWSARPRSSRSACAGRCRPSSSSSPWPASASPSTSRRATRGPRSPSSCWPAACSPCSRSLRRERVRATDALAGGVTAIAGGGARPVHPRHDHGGGRPAAQGLAPVGHPRRADRPLPLRPDAELPAAARPRRGRGGHARPVGRPHRTGGRTSSRTSAGPAGAAASRTDCELQPEPVDGGWVYEVPPAQPAPQGRPVTQRFEIVSTYTDRLFAGRLADRGARAAAPAAADDRRVGDRRHASARTHARVHRHRGRPGSGADRPHRAGPLLPEGRGAALPGTPVPAAAAGRRRWPRPPSGGPPRPRSPPAASGWTCTR